MRELLSDVAGFDEGREHRQAGGLGPTEELEFVTRRVLLEDVGAEDFGMKFPDRVETPRVVGFVVAVHEVAIRRGEGDHPGFVQHAEQFGARLAHEPATDFGFLFALGLAYKKYWF